MKVTCVLAHQDDEMRCLGTLLRMREAGHAVSFVCVTAGDKGLAFSTQDSHKRAAAIRDEEMRSVADLLDAEYVCLGYEDGFVFEDDELRRRLIREMRRLGTDLLFTHWTSEYNSDHVVVGKATTDAALFTALPSFEPDEPPLPAVPRIYYLNPGDGYGFEATHFVELSADHVTSKVDTIRRHSSQMEVMRRLRGSDYADEMLLEDRRQGARLLTGYAESFRPCLSERRIPWPTDLPGSLTGERAGA